MNRINLILTLILLSSYQGLAQKEISVISNTKIVGENFLTGQPIKATVSTFPNRIHDFHIDTVNGYLTFHLRGLSKNGKWLKTKGHVVRYDNKNKEVLWSKKINFHVESIEESGGITLHTSNGKSYCLDNETGESLWEAKNSLVFSDVVNKVGMGYRFQPSKGRKNLLEGIELNTGLPIWQRKIDRDYGWDDLFYLNDSTLLVCAAGLHTINIFDGKGWDYNTVTGKKDYTASAVGTGLGIAAGLLTGMYSVSTGYNLVRGVVSNVLIDSSNIYYASREHLVKLTRQGEIIWQKVLPKDLTSKSRIFLYDDNLIMVNRGYAYMGYRQLSFGTPFIASFNIATGEQNYFAIESAEDKKIIKGLDYDNDELLIVFNDHVTQYSMNDGRRIADKTFNIEECGDLRFFVGDRVFIKQDSMFLSLPEVDSTKHYLYTRSETVLVLSEDLETESKIEAKDLYIYYSNKNGKSIFVNEGQAHVVGANGRKVAEFSIEGSSTLSNGKFYNTHENSFLEIDLENILVE